MATINFPVSPVLNQIFIFQGKRWRWNGRGWQAESNGVAQINPTLVKDGDIQVIGSVISMYSDGAWRQVFPAVYS